MVSPEGTGAQPDRPRTGQRALLAAAALVIAAGFGVLGALSPAEEMAVETTTTTTTPATTTTVIGAPIDLDNFDVGQIVTGEPLDLEQVAEIEAGYPVALLEHDGSYYLFASSRPAWMTDEGGLMAWRSRDGVEWESLGFVIDTEFVVTSVTASPDHLLAAGTSIGGEELMVWQSDDGVTWAHTGVETFAAAPNTRTYVSAVGSNDEYTMVAASTEPDVKGMVEDGLAASGNEIDLARWGWGIDTAPPEPALMVHGPLGILIVEIDLDELDLDEEEQQLLVEGSMSGPEMDIWVSGADSQWNRSVIEGMYGVESIRSDASGRMMVTGYGTSGVLTATTSDGQNWEVQGTRGNGPWSVQIWGDLLVGADDMSVPELLISKKGEGWEKAGLAELFPVAINWSTYPMAAGPGGVTMAVSGSSGGPQMETQEPVTLATDLGALVSLDFSTGRVAVEAGTVIHTWQMWSQSTPEGVTMDLATETIEFSDPETGTLLGALTFDELQRAENEFYQSQYRGDDHRALVFTPDGENWTIQDLADSIGPEAAITNLMVGSDTLVAVVLPEGDWYYPMLDPGFEIWTAPLPSYRPSR